MDILSRYKKQVGDLNRLKAFLQQLDPSDFELISLLTSLDSKINKAEDVLNNLRGNNETLRCGICIRRFDEAEPVAVDSILVCPTCREQGGKWKLGTTWEEIYDLPPGTIKRDCFSKDNEHPKLQSYIDVGLIHKSGIHSIVHENVILMYYMNAEKYKRKKSKNIFKP